MNERFTVIPTSVITDEKLDLYEFRILSYLISCSKNGVCFPGKNDISKKTGIGYVTVNSRVQSLIEKGYLKKSIRTIGKGKKTSNLYKLNKKILVTKEFREERLVQEELYDYDWLNEGVRNEGNID